MSKYEVDGVEYPSVTTIQGILDKPFMVPWALNMMEQKMCEMLEEDPGGLLDVEGIKNMLLVAKIEHKNVSREALDIGSEVHDLVEKYIKYGKDAVGIISDEAQNGFLAFLHWEEKNVLKWVESEKKVYSRYHGYAGTLDAIAIMKEEKGKTDKIIRKEGSVYLIDFKTSKAFYSGYDEQLAAYRQARHECIGTTKYSHTVDGVVSEFVETYGDVYINGTGILRLDKITGIPEFKDYTKTIARKTDAFLSLVKYYYKQKKRRLKNNKHVG